MTRSRLLLCTCAGAALGLLLFAFESALIVRSGSVVLDVDATTAVGQVLAAARPQLVPLLLRIAAAYVVCGAALGALMGALASDASRSKTGFWLLWPLDMAALCLLAAWAAAIARPGLFEDVESLRAVLASIVHHGRLWQPAVFALILFGLHLWRSVRPTRTALHGVAAVSALLVPRALPHLTQKGPRAPLVVVIGIDAFRPDRLETGTRHVAPNLERFLSDAVRFDRAYTPIAQTEPAWASLLTASWPYRTGVRHSLTADTDRAPLPTFAGAFAAAGFATSFDTDCSRFNWLGPASGFHERVEPPHGALNFVLEKLRYRGLGIFAVNALGSRWVPEMIDNRALAGFYDPEQYAARLADRLVSEARRGPLLFAYHDTTTHYPGDAVYPHYLAHPDAPLRMTYSAAGSGPGAVAKREELYDELLSAADAQVGLLLQRLRDEGLYDGAWIVVFSDHGEGFQPDVPAVSGMIPVHGARLSDDENRILLAIKAPAGSGIAGGRTLHDLVRLIDLGPTLLDAAGLAPLPKTDGVSLLPLLRGETLAPLKLYAETGYTHIPPDAFDPRHFSTGTRGFDAYRIASGGVVEMTPEAHGLALHEKDVGAFDGQGWIVREPLADGTVRELCRGNCSADLRTWLEARR